MLTTRRRIRKGSISARLVNGVRVKVWVARNIAGDYYATAYKVGCCTRFQPVRGYHPVVEELVREYVVAKRQGRR